MPTDSSSHRPAPRRLRRWLRTLLALFLASALVLVAGIYFATRHLPRLAKWALERTFPGATVEIRKLEIAFPNRLTAESLILKSRKDGATLLTLAGGSITFNFDDLRRRQISEVRLVEPVINASPRLLEAFAAPPGAQSSAKAGVPWAARRLVCDYGELNIADYGPAGLTIHTKFSFDFKNFSPATAPAEPHELVLWDATANTGSDPPFLRLAGGSITFNFDDLRHRQISEVRLVEPVINASPRLTEAFATPPGAQSSAKAGVPWAVRRFVCDYGELNLADYGPAGLTIHTKFCFDFKNFSPATAPTEPHELVLWDATANTGSDPAFLRLDLVRAKFDLEGLIKNQTVNALALEGGSLVFGKSLREIFAGPKDDSAQASSVPASWILAILDIRRIAVRLDDERPEVSDITFALNTSLKNIPLSKSASSLGSEQQLVEIANLEILSPLDPFTKVLTLDSIFLRFTLAGLLRREIDSLTILGPNIFVGADLFWYMDDMQKRLGTDGDGKDSGPGWMIKTLGIEYGRLTLGSGGRRQYGLPLSFRTTAQDVALDNLAALKLQAVLEIPPQKYVFDSYQLEFTSEKGELRFAYPPEKNVNNLVGTVRIKGIRWRQYKASDSYISVTFDRNGINGLFGGKVYRGETWGGFSFFFSPDSPWIGWLSGRGVSLREVTNIISPQNFQLTGPMEFRLQMDAKGRNVERVLGELRATKPGKMVIGKIDDLLARIPPTWNLIKQSSTRIALETLRDFEYTKASGDFWFVQSQGQLRLTLQGPAGSRNFDVILHAEDSPQGRWKRRSANR